MLASSRLYPCTNGKKIEAGYTVGMLVFLPSSFPEFNGDDTDSDYFHDDLPNCCPLLSQSLSSSDKSAASTGPAGAAAGTTTRSLKDTKGSFLSHFLGEIGRNHSDSGFDLDESGHAVDILSGCSSAGMLSRDPSSLSEAAAPCFSTRTVFGNGSTAGGGGSLGSAAHNLSTMAVAGDSCSASGSSASHDHGHAHHLHSGSSNHHHSNKQHQHQHQHQHSSQGMLSQSTSGPDICAVKSAATFGDLADLATSSADRAEAEAEALLEDLALKREALFQVSVNGAPVEHSEETRSCIAEIAAGSGKIYPTVSLFSEDTRVWCRFCEADVVFRTREKIGAPPGVRVYCLDGTLLLEETD
jgi:hypothetical protein